MSVDNLEVKVKIVDMRVLPLKKSFLGYSVQLSITTECGGRKSTTVFASTPWRIESSAQAYKDKLIEYINSGGRYEAAPV